MILRLDVHIEVGDCPEPRARLLGHRRSIVKAVTEEVDNALGVIWPSERYPTVIDDESYRKPRVRHIGVRVEGPRDTFKGG